MPSLLDSRQPATEWGEPERRIVRRQFDERCMELHTFCVLSRDLEAKAFVKSHGQPIGFVDIASKRGDAVALRERMELGK